MTFTAAFVIFSSRILQPFFQPDTGQKRLDFAPYVSEFMQLFFRFSLSEA